MKYYVKWSEWLRSGNDSVPQGENMDVLCRGETVVEAASKTQAIAILQCAFPRIHIRKNAVSADI